MKSSRKFSNSFGLSWASRRLRVGRTQYGNWWVSLRLPFGFKFTKKFDRLNVSSPTVPSNAQIHDTDTGSYAEVCKNQQIEPTNLNTKSYNQEIFEKMKRRSK